MENPILLDLIIIISRAFVLLICCVIAGMSIWVGAHMYKDTVSSQSVADVSAMGIKFVMKSSGPGLFLIGFGIFLLSVIVLQQSTIAESSASLNVGGKSDSKQVQVAEEKEPNLSNEEVENDDFKHIVVAKIASIDKNLKTYNLSDTQENICLLKTKSRVFATGQDSLTKENVKKSIEKAIYILKNLDQEQSANIIEQMTVVSNLEQILQGVEDE
jgi:hypothetical protein